MQVYILAKDYTKLIRVHSIINLIIFSKKCDLILKWQNKLKFEKSSFFQKPVIESSRPHDWFWNGVLHWDLVAKCIQGSSSHQNIYACWHGFPQGMSVDNVGYNLF